MTYNLAFLPSAKKEWGKLDNVIRLKFKKKLAERLEIPKVPKDKLKNMSDCYRIKLRSDGYRLVYQVDDFQITVLVVCIGKREHGYVYEMAQARFLGSDLSNFVE